MVSHEQGRYRILVDENGSHMVWPTGLENPLGWRNGGSAGTIEDCLIFIAATWTDMLLRTQHG
jgi:uncharacterized protein YbdZ (MbtH family)